MKNKIMLMIFVVIEMIFWVSCSCISILINSIPAAIYGFGFLLIALFMPTFYVMVKKK